MSNENIIATLTKLASTTKSRKDFNQSVENTYGTRLGAGAFRKVYDAGNVVIKLRRHVPKHDNKFPMARINSSNKEEIEGYESFKKNTFFIHFILQPTYVALPNKHDAVLMDKVDYVLGELSYDEQERLAEEKPNLYKQIQVIKEVFHDGHDFNIGIIGERAYLIDFNFCGTWDGMMKHMKATARKCLEAAGVKFKGRKPKVKLKVFQAAA